VSVCPNCGRSVDSHRMFDPPRCPVVRLKWPVARSWDEAVVMYARWSVGEKSK
jgi:hypothetical protein